MCAAEWHDHTTGTCNGQAVVCDRPAHLPGEWHRNRQVGIVWVVDRRYDGVHE